MKRTITALLLAISMTAAAQSIEIDTITTSPPEDPFYYEITVTKDQKWTHTVHIRKRSHWHHRQAIWITDPAGELLTEKEIESFMATYLPDWSGTYEITRGHTVIINQQKTKRDELRQTTIR